MLEVTPLTSRLDRGLPIRWGCLRLVASLRYQTEIITGVNSHQRAAKMLLEL